MTSISVNNAGELVEIAVIDDPTRAVYSVAWAPDGSLLATSRGFFSSGGGDTSVRIWGL